MQSSLPLKPPQLTIQIVSPQVSPSSRPSIPHHQFKYELEEKSEIPSPMVKYSIPCSSPLPNSPYFFTGPAAYSDSSPINIFHFLLSLITFTLLCVCYIVFFLI